MSVTGPVPIEKVRPLVLWLLGVYGGIDTLSEVSGFTTGTINTWAYASAAKSVKAENARVLVELVQRHTRTKDPFPSPFENDGKRLATIKDARMEREFARWKPSELEEAIA